MTRPLGCAGKPDPARGVRSCWPELLSACFVALIAVVGAVQTIAGARGSNHQSETNGADTLFFAAFLLIVLAWGYGMALRRRKLPLERKVDELSEEVRDVGDGIGRVEDILTAEVGQQTGPLASVHTIY